MEKENVTGLYYFDVFKERASKLMEERDDLMLISLNIDNFKYINQTYGFKKGDELLQWVAEIFCRENQQCLLSAREFSDHFLILSEHHEESEEKAMTNLQRLQVYFSRSIAEEFPLSSIHINSGIYFINEKTEGISEAIDKAELARKNIKGNYQVHVAVYNEELQHEADLERKVIPLVEQATKNNSIFTYFQPKIEIDTGKIVGAEALVRLRDENGLILSPALFIPILERAGFISKMDFTVIRQVCQLIYTWREQGYQVVPISVNLSRADFLTEDLFHVIDATLRDFPIPKSLLEFEVTETLFVDDMDFIIEKLHKLRSEGFKVSIDDFGSGYSSLNAVSILPADIVKFDRSFIQNSLDHARGRSIIIKMIEIFQELDITVICEGVETASEKELVRACGCRYVQGYVYDRPMAASIFEEKYMQEGHFA